MIRKCCFPRSVRLPRCSGEALVNWDSKCCNQISCRNNSTSSIQSGDSASLNALSSPEWKTQQSVGDRPVERHSYARRHSQIPQFRAALFGQESSDLRARRRRDLNAIIAAYGDAHNVATWLRSRKSPLNASDLNALQSRYEYLGGVLKPEKVREHMLLAADSPSAIKQRLLAHDAMIRGNLCQPDDIQLSTREFFDFMRNVAVPDGDSWYERNLKRQWLHVITGWSRNGIGGPAEQRARCLYHLGPDLYCSYWRHYLGLLCKFGDSKVVYSEWKSHQAKHGSLVDALNQTIRSLVKLEDPEHAWHLAYETGNVTEYIREDTWQLLLAYPQHIKEWIPEMTGPALRMLEEEICKVERHLGLQWIGGQDGSHTRRGPQMLFSADMV